MRWQPERRGAVPAPRQGGRGRDRRRRLVGVARRAASRDRAGPRLSWGSAGSRSLTCAEVARYVPRRVAPRPLPRFPAVTRDLAVVVDETFHAGDIVEEIRALGNPQIESVRLFDCYRGAPIPSRPEEPRLLDRLPRRRPQPHRRRGERRCTATVLEHLARPLRARAPELRTPLDDHDQGRHRRAHLREGRLLQEGGHRGRRVDLRAGQGAGSSAARR